MRIHQLTPWEIVYGKPPTMPYDQLIEKSVTPEDRPHLLYERIYQMIDQVPIVCQSAKHRMKINQQKIERPIGYQLNIGDKVLYWDKQREMSHSGKLEPKWKGLYRVEAILPKGAYKISYDGKTLKASTHGSLLRKIDLDKGEPIMVIGNAWPESL